ncbi:alanine racemase [Nitrosococcus halophilus Nc 4]|uniref:Alanine racemase n=1 Tax=Nitrosococcus halophilus (strain Nc4) TaxID=472759 RepID=D5C1J7_NITHN|nr:alanine racemase [Nitrosococcus halophilus]ADE16549.1 alanine racemase [Nitrosococcus halophilus Nc 4]
MNFPQAIIDLSALRHNLQRVRELVPRSRVMAVVKADGYGHGLKRIAQVLAEAHAFAVARLGEALVLRQAGYRGDIVLLEGIADKEELQLAAAYHLTLVVHEATQLDLLWQAPVNAPLSVWLKVDTGMHRLGFPPERVAEAVTSLRRCPAVAAVVGLMSHLANADQAEDSLTAIQLETFERITVPGLWRSMANSAAVIACPQAHFDWVRPGLMLYGVSPFAHCTGAAVGLKPVMTLKTRLIAIHHLHPGDSIGYGATWVCPEAMAVGVAAIGYGDGYPRHAAPGTPLLVNGRPVPLVGRVSMDMVTLDLRSQPEAKVGDPVIVWGAGLPVEEIACHAATIPYELLCQVTARVPRIRE